MLLRLCALCALLWLPPAAAGEALPDPAAELPLSRDLAADAALAAQGRLPLLLLVSQRECGFCRQLKEGILYPTIRSGNYRGRVLFREVLMDADETLRDLQGVSRSGDAFARGYGVDISPTLLFLAPDGREVAKRLIGLSGTPELMFVYLDEALEQAIATMTAGR
jgi:thioredoxin-related protein